MHVATVTADSTLAVIVPSLNVLLQMQMFVAGLVGFVLDNTVPGEECWYWNSMEDAQAPHVPNADCALLTSTPPSPLPQMCSHLHRA